MLTLDELRRIFPRSGAVATHYVEPLNFTFDEFQIDNPERQAAFLGNVGVESAELSRTSENLNYSSAERIVKIFPTSFRSIAEAQPYVMQPQKLANRVYANKYGNGNESSGDGWRNRGAGLLQATFDENHRACAEHFRIPRDQVGEWMRTPMGAARSAGFWWSRNACNQLADAGQFAVIVRKVNRAMLEMARRMEYRATALRVFGAE